MIATNTHGVKRHLAGDDPSNTTQLIDLLRRGGGWMFTQGINPGRGGGVSNWIAPGKRLFYPPSWDGAKNVYFGVNPAVSPVTDADRARHPGKTDYSIMPFVASKNKSICAVNTLIADVDGKDLTDPTKAEIDRAFDIVRADMLDRVASGELTRETPERGLWNQAVNYAQDEKYQADPGAYLAAALAAIDGLPCAPSALVYSGGGYQAYWILDQPYAITNDDSRSYIQGVYRRWNQFIGGDPACKDLRRIFRLPGTLNIKPKYAPNYPVATIERLDTSRLYSIDQLVAMLPDETRDTASRTDQERRTDRKTYAREDGRSHGQQYSNSVMRVMGVYNSSHRIVDELLSVGYTRTADDRMSRPGEENSNGVQINLTSNGSFHHSSNDPLYSDRLRRPFDVRVVYDYGGNAEIAARQIGWDMGIVSRERLADFLAVGRGMVATALWRDVVSHDMDGRCGDTNRKLYSNLLDHAERIGKVKFILSCRQLARSVNSDGHMVSTCSPQTALNFTERLNGILFTAKNDDNKTITFHLADVVSKLDRSYINNDVLDLSKLLTTSLYATHKGDDAFARGTSTVIKKTAWSQVDGGDFREVLSGFLPSIGSLGLVVLCSVIENPGAVVSDITENTGLKSYTVRNALRKLELWALVDSEQEHKKAPKEYTATGSVWSHVRALTPSCRSHMIGVGRLEKQLQVTQAWAERRAATSDDEIILRSSYKRATVAASQRMELLSIMYPDMSQDEIKKFVLTPGSRHRPWIDRRAELNHAADAYAEKQAALRPVIAEFYDQGVRTVADAYRMAQYLGYDEVESKRIAYGVKDYRPSATVDFELSDENVTEVEL